MSTVRSLAKAVISHLEPGWTLEVKPCKCDGTCRCDQHAVLKHEEGMSLRFGRNYREHGRVHVTGELPTAKDGSTRPYNEYGPSITVGLERSAQAVAKDIQRRLFPAYDKVWAEGMKQVKDANAYRDQQEANVKMLAAVVGGEVRKEGRFYVSRGDWYMNGSAGDKSVHLEIHCLTVDQAKRVLEVLAGG